MVRRDLSRYDASDRASLELEYVIRDRKSQELKKEKSISVEEAISDKRIIKGDQNRNVTRVLFISQNKDLLNPSQQTLDGYLNISELFSEVHILILRVGIPSKKPVLRVAPNVWLYTATSKVWWGTSKAGVKLMSEQLEFANGFRPDLIVARDPFESAFVAKNLANKYKKPTQLHLLEDFTAKKFIKRRKNNFWRKVFLFLVTQSFSSIRTGSKNLLKIAEEKFTANDIQELPRLNNYEILLDYKSEVVLKDIYKPLVFFMLYVGNLNETHDVFTVMDSARSFLRNPRLGLLIIGDGREKDEIRKRAKLLGIDGQVIIESRPVDIPSYLKSSNILFVSQTSAESEELVLKGAAAGIPMIMTKTEARENIFEDKEDAFLCDADDAVNFTAYTHELINNVGLRNKFSRNTQEIIKDKFYKDPKAYQAAYRESIEQALFVDKEV